MAVEAPNKPKSGTNDAFSIFLLQLAQRGFETNTLTDEERIQNTNILRNGNGLKGTFSSAASPTYNLDTANDQALRATLNRGIVEAYVRLDPLGYELGSKGRNGRTIDCSGFVAAATINALHTLQKETGFSATRVASEMQNCGDAQFEALLAYTGGQSYNKEQLNRMAQSGQLKAGMFIAIDSGEYGFSKGRKYGTDHVVETCEINGQIYVVESTKGGVKKTLASDWMENRIGQKNTQLRGIDLVDVVKKAKMGGPTANLANPALAGAGIRSEFQSVSTSSPEEPDENKNSRAFLTIFMAALFAPPEQFEKILDATLEELKVDRSNGDVKSVVHNVRAFATDQNHPARRLGLNEAALRLTGYSFTNAPTLLNPALLAAMRSNPAVAERVRFAMQEADRQGLNKGLFVNQLWSESEFNPNARSPVGARGIGQFMPETGRGYGLKTEADFLDAHKSIAAAARHMRDLTREFGDQRLALVAYNGGGGAIKHVEKQLGRDATIGDWMSFMARERQAKGEGPSSSWRNQTFEYVAKIDSSLWNRERQVLAQQRMMEMGLGVRLAQASIETGVRHPAPSPTG